MNILDENIPESQRQLLRSWRIRVRQIGHEIGSPGMKDEEIISRLHRFHYITSLFLIWVSTSGNYVILTIV